MEEQKRDFSELEKLYLDVKEWIKFAETKNAALLTFNVASLFGFIKLEESQDGLFEGANIILFLSLVTLIISIFIVLFSFFPKRVEKVVFKELKEGHKFNLLFYYNISKISLHNLKKDFAQRYYSQGIKDDYYADLVEQIHAISSLTVIKNNHFKLGMLVTIGAYSLFMFYFIYTGLK